ncbi:MAG: hypothetical protein ACSLE6_17815 [Mycobacterium sp.]
MTGMLPQLLAQLTAWLTHQHRDRRLTLDSLEARPGLAPVMHALTDSLQHAIRYAQHTGWRMPRRGHAGRSVAQPFVGISVLLGGT